MSDKEGNFPPNGEQENKNKPLNSNLRRDPTFPIVTNDGKDVAKEFEEGLL
jgi:hypothetical protein